MQKFYTIYIVVNGTLGMSPGKIAAQTFQACQRMYALARTDNEVHELLQAWENSNTKTIVKIARTEHLFQRSCDELSGVSMVDEGKNEVDPGSTTVFATFPIARCEPVPKILTHKKMPMFTLKEISVQE